MESGHHALEGQVETTHNLHTCSVWIRWFLVVDLVLFLSSTIAHACNICAPAIRNMRLIALFSCVVTPPAR